MLLMNKKQLLNIDLAKRHKDILEGCDGEVIAGDIFAKGVLQRSNSFCMSEDKLDDFVVYLFDRYLPDVPWYERWYDLKVNQTYFPACVYVLDHHKVVSEEYLDNFEKELLGKGAEGVIVRDAYGKYKFGRSGTINPEIQKLKRFVDDEFLVVGYEQFESNQNEAKVNELGHTSRSSSKEGKVLVDKLGSLVLQTKDGIRFNCGTGFTDELRLQLWKDRDNLVGKLAKIKFFHYSKDNVPLLPVFLDFRSKIDL